MTALVRIAYTTMMHLRDYMAEKKLKDEDVAKKIGVARTIVLRYRHGTLRPRLEVMQRIAAHGATFTRDDVPL